ncbi:MAG: hypothetical protein ACREIC_01840 [Limisphaerales bacterium]
MGLALRRTLERAPHDPEMKHEINVIWRWMETRLTLDEAEHVMVTTGNDFAGFFDIGDEPPLGPAEDDPDIPFGLAAACVKADQKFRGSTITVT